MGMSEKQLSALVAILKDHADLREKIQSAADLDAIVTMAQEAGFDVNMANTLKTHAQQTLELTDEELDRVSAGCVSLETFAIWGAVALIAVDANLGLLGRAIDDLSGSK